MIKHLVCSGSGPHGLSQLGIIVEYERQGLLDLSKLEKVYGCSAGSLLGIVLLLNIPLDAVIEYIINRPWNKFMKVELLEMNDRGGVIHCEKIKDMLIPLLLAYDVPLDITIKQAHDRCHSNIELHIFSTNLSICDHFRC